MEPFEHEENTLAYVHNMFLYENINTGGKQNK